MRPLYPSILGAPCLKRIILGIHDETDLPRPFECLILVLERIVEYYSGALKYFLEKGKQNFGACGLHNLQYNELQLASFHALRGLNFRSAELDFRHV